MVPTSWQDEALARLAPSFPSEPLPSALGGGVGGRVPGNVKHLPAMQETQVRSLGWEDPLENGMATYSSILAWRISWTEEPGGLLSMGSERVRHD